MQDVYAKIYLQPSLEILVAKFSHELIACLGTAAIDGWQRHAVEGVGLDHGVERHVLKYDLLTGAERHIERILTDDVACEAGAAGQQIGERLLPGSPPRYTGGRYGTSSTSGIWHAAEVSRIAMSLWLCITSSTVATR